MSGIKPKQITALTNSAAMLFVAIYKIALREDSERTLCNNHLHVKTYIVKNLYNVSTPNVHFSSLYLTS